MSEFQRKYKTIINDTKLVLNKNREKYERSLLDYKFRLDEFLVTDEPRDCPLLYKSLLQNFDESNTDMRINREIYNHLIKSLDDYYKKKMCCQSIK